MRVRLFLLYVSFFSGHLLFGEEGASAPSDVVIEDSADDADENGEIPNSSFFRRVLGGCGSIAYARTRRQADTCVCSL